MDGWAGPSLGQRTKRSCRGGVVGGVEQVGQSVLPKFRSSSSSHHCNFHLSAQARSRFQQPVIKSEKRKSYSQTPSSAKFQIRFLRAALAHPVYTAHITNLCSGSGSVASLRSPQKQIILPYLSNSGLYLQLSNKTEAYSSHLSYRN